VELDLTHCYCHRRDAALKPEGKAAHTTIRVFLTYRVCVSFPVKNTVILHCFDVISWRTGRASGPELDMFPNPTRPTVQVTQPNPSKIVSIKPTRPDQFRHKFAISINCASFTCLTTSQKLQRRHTIEDTMKANMFTVLFKKTITKQVFP